MTPPADKPSAPWEDRESSLGDLFNKLTHHKPTLWPEEREAARAELAALRQRADDLEAALRDAVRTWTFSDAQFPEHSWHDREDWYERHAVAREVRAALRSGGEGEK